MAICSSAPVHKHARGPRLPFELCLVLPCRTSVSKLLVSGRGHGDLSRLKRILWEGGDCGSRSTLISNDWTLRPLRMAASNWSQGLISDLRDELTSFRMTNMRGHCQMANNHIGLSWRLSQTIADFRPYFIACPCDEVPRMVSIDGLRDKTIAVRVSPRHWPSVAGAVCVVSACDCEIPETTGLLGDS